MQAISVEAYREAMAAHHSQLTAHPTIRVMFDPQVEPQLLHRFLVEYCALGVQLTEPVEGWIRRAGARCKELGLAQLGDSLIKHAAHEAGHEKLFINDARKLGEQHLARYGDALDVEALLRQPPTPATTRYTELHEETIAGETPYAQVAIELEIEGLSVSLGPTFLKQLERVLGAETLACCSFLTEHVAVDVGHTALNEKLLGRLIQAHPEALPALVAAGKRALDAYLSFLSECMDRARAAVQTSGVAQAVGR
jgi:pyrroloquinoline quinone (PQQ) biosynthesis protein C